MNKPYAGIRSRLRRSLEARAGGTAAQAILRVASHSPFASWPNDRNYLFIHIPRTAGGSVARALSDGGMAHHSIASYYAHDRARTDKLWKFTFVRDPVDRFYSAFERVRSSDAIPPVRDWSRRVLGFFPKADDLAKAMHRDRGLREEVLTQAHFRPQVEWISIDGRIVMDFIGRFENLAADYAEVAARVPEANDTLPWANKSNNAERKDLPSLEERQVVADLYENDMALLEYDLG